MATTKELANTLAASADADIILINAPIDRGLDVKVIDACNKGVSRPNAIVIVVTSGGDADVAYRIARTLQDRYTKVTALVWGYCKSAGTLLVIGAHELVISDYGELGPLDVQLRKADDLWANTSGLTVMQALSALQAQSEQAFAEFAANIKLRSGGSVTFKTAADIAQKLTVGLFAHVYQQVEVMHVGEAARAMKIAEEYGKRLDQVSDNLLSEASLSQLVVGYPSHGFIIDRKEADTLFMNVRAPKAEESELCTALGDLVRVPNATSRIQFLSDKAIAKAVVNDTQQTVGAGAAGQEPGTQAAPELPATAAQTAEGGGAEVVQLHPAATGS